MSYVELTLLPFLSVTKERLIVLKLYNAHLFTKFTCVFADEPQFLVEPQSTVVAPQDEVTLRCEPRALSTQILWVFNGEFITSSDEDGLEITHGRLHIRSFRHRRIDGRNQAGTYQCIARNSVGAVISREAVVQQACKYIVGWCKKVLGQAAGWAGLCVEQGVWERIVVVYGRLL